MTKHLDKTEQDLSQCLPPIIYMYQQIEPNLLEKIMSTIFFSPNFLQVAVRMTALESQYESSLQLFLVGNKVISKNISKKSRRFSVGSVQNLEGLHLQASVLHSVQYLS